MPQFLSRCPVVAPAFLLALLVAVTPPASAQTAGSGTSELVVWNCAGSPCPWGSSLSGHALVWPAGSGAVAGRLGYQTSRPIYLPADVANGAIIWVDSGVASLYAGAPDAGSHRFIANVSAGDYYMVSGLAAGEVLSAQSGSRFDYQIDLAPAPEPEVPGAASSQLVTWDCSGSPCPWGSSASAQAAVWPADTVPGSSRLGYTTSQAVYLPEGYANGATIAVDRGAATLYAGLPDGSSHRVLGTIGTGEQFTVGGLATGEVMSLQNGSDRFDYRIVALGVPSGGGGEAPTVNLSTPITWSCGGSPCPWGTSVSGNAIAWPAVTGPTASRFAYTTSSDIYLPAAYANATTVHIESGSAILYAGHPDANSHRVLATLSDGNFFEVSGLQAGEVLSVQNDYDTFSYRLEIGDPVEPEPVIPGPGSQVVTWSCTGAYCPWGNQLSGNAVVWPEEVLPQSERFDYTTSKAIYLPYRYANGTSISLTNGGATVYAGQPNATSHRVLATISAGGSYVVAGVGPGEVVSVQNDWAAFEYQATPGQPVDEEPGDPPAGEPDGTVHSIAAYWRCDSADCNGDDWTGAVINWPSWAAYPNNNRSGNMSRTVYSASGEMLFPYMGSWANGCEVTVQAGQALIIEWERGTDVWRETFVNSGETHVISLVSPEDGALIETNDITMPFSVTLANCDPQPLVE